MGTKLLCITEKYCDMNPKWLTNTLHNVINTARRSNLFEEVNAVHFDELFLEGKDQNLEVMKAFTEKKPDLVVMQLLAFQNCNPSLDVIAAINKCVPIIMMWPDSWGSWSHNKINELGQLIDLHIVWDTYKIATKHNNKILFMPAPQDGSLYYPRGGQDIEVSMMGSLRQPGRQKLVDDLKDRNIAVLTGGGQREINLPPHVYAEFISASMISLNTSWTSLQGVHQLKGRVIEILLSGSLLMEPANDITPKFFNPTEDYVPFYSIDDCAAKINYYLKHDDEREKITTSGRLKALEFSDQKYWEKVLKVLNKTKK